MRNFFDNLRIRLANSDDLQAAVFYFSLIVVIAIALLACGAE